MRWLPFLLLSSQRIWNTRTDLSNAIVVLMSWDVISLPGMKVGREHLCECL